MTSDRLSENQSDRHTERGIIDRQTYRQDTDTRRTEDNPIGGRKKENLTGMKRQRNPADRHR